jgi:threonine dehydratase
VSGFHFPVPGDVLDAARRLRGVARHTPLERSLALSERAGAEIHLKLENQQRAGSFKIRGAYNHVATLPGEVRGRGLVSASAGNHGQGVALTARIRRLPARIFVPESTPETKRRRIARFGAELRVVPGAWEDAHAAALADSRETGRAYVHAFSDPMVVAGQGTVGLEILRDLPSARTLVVPVGGGGLIGGIGIIARAMGTGVRIVGVQSDRTSAMHASLAAGTLSPGAQGPTLCEGLAGETDAYAVALNQAFVDELVLVSEDAVRRAMRWLFDEEGIVAEGSAAVAVAALLEGAVRTEGPVAVIITGGNVDAGRLASILGGE